MRLAPAALDLGGGAEVLGPGEPLEAVLQRVHRLLRHGQLGRGRQHGGQVEADVPAAGEEDKNNGSESGKNSLKKGFQMRDYKLFLRHNTVKK